MKNFILSFMSRYGYLGILLLIIIENIFPPIPSELILTFGGFMTTYTSMNVLGVIIFSTLGSILGAIILYYMGYLLNKDRLLHLASSRLGRILHFNAANINKSLDWFHDKGNNSVFFCRFVPILRSLISIPAGMCKMNQGKFLLYTTIGSLGWNTILIFLGHLVGESWDELCKLFHHYSYAIRYILIALFILWIYKKLKK